MVYDGARFVADQTLRFTRFGQFWNDVHQSSQLAFRTWVEATAPWLWNSVDQGAAGSAGFRRAGCVRYSAHDPVPAAQAVDRLFAGLTGRIPARRVRNRAAVAGVETYIEAHCIEAHLAAPLPRPPMFAWRNSMLFMRKTTALPSAAEALPGRANPIPTATTHFVNGRKLQPPYPDRPRTGRVRIGLLLGRGAQVLGARRRHLCDRRRLCRRAYGQPDL